MQFINYQNHLVLICIHTFHKNFLRMHFQIETLIVIYIFIIINSYYINFSKFFMDKFEKYARGQVEYLLSSVVNIHSFAVHGLTHIKIITKAVWYKSRIFVKAILLKINQEQYKSNIFFLVNHAINFDEMVSIQGEIIFYKYLYLQSENHFTLKAALDKKVSYQPSVLENQLIKTNQFLFRSVKFSYSNFNYNLLSIPDCRIFIQTKTKLQFLLAMQKQKDQHYEDIQLSQFKQMKQFRGRRLSELFGKNVLDWISYHQPITFKYHDCIFLIQLQMTYEIVEEYTQSQSSDSNGKITQNKTKIIKTRKFKYPQGKFHQELFLIGDQFIKQKYNNFVKIKGNDVDELILDLFSKKINRVNNLYSRLTQRQLKNIYSVKTFDNLTVEMIPYHCKIGDILMIQNKGKYSHAAVYLDMDTIIQVKVQSQAETQIKKLQSEEKIFRLDNYQNFIKKQENNKIIVLRLFYCPYTKMQILMRETELSNINMNSDNNENCEHKSFQLMTGIKFSWQQVWYQLNHE